MDDDERFQERLRALDAAVPPMRGDSRAVLDRGRRPPTLRVMTRLPGVAAALVVVVALAVLGLRGGNSGASPARPPMDPTPTSRPTNASGVELGPDGLPTRIDGERVYTMNERDAWPADDRRFLLVAVPSVYLGSGVAFMHRTDLPSTPAERDLVSLNESLLPVGGSATPLTFAPKSEASIFPFSWGGAVPIVLRVHTHDPEAAQCGAFLRERCESGIVGQSILWPTVPSSVDGHRVLRAADVNAQSPGGAYRSLGTFYLGGVAAVQAPGVMAGSCDSYGSPAEQKLLATCHPQFWVDSLLMAPMSTFEPQAGRLVVVRVHTNDPLAAECPESVRSACENAIVADAVVWSSDPYAKLQGR